MRLIREAFRRNKAAMPIGVDLVILPRGQKLTFDEVNSALPILANDVVRRLRGNRGLSPSASSYSQERTRPDAGRPT